MSVKLVLVRHGQSIWNLENLFTGWTDVDLTAQGCEEARQAGRELRRPGSPERTELEPVRPGDAITFRLVTLDQARSLDEAARRAHAVALQRIATLVQGAR